MEWESAQYSRNQIKQAGVTIIKDDITNKQRDHALKVIDNWRAAHAYPLNVISCNLKRIAGDDGRALVVQRLKRLDSIIDKLNRFPIMDLHEMQDIGGCRVITDNLETMYKIISTFQNSRIRHIFCRRYDYIENPKTTGYRSIHLVYKYKSDVLKTYNNLYIEIQFRTRLQHLWATAVETMDIYTGSQLKSGRGNAEILRFFALVSSLFALDENTPPVPGVPCDTHSLLSEIRDIDSRFNIINKLSAIKVAFDVTDQKMKVGYYLLLLNFRTRHLQIKYYKKSKIANAAEDYRNIEVQNDEDIDALLVSTSSFDSLKSAYPNYFSDISGFISYLNDKLNDTPQA